MEQVLKDISRHVSQAVAHYWLTRETQLNRQKTLGRSDQGARSAVTGGVQMDGFIQLVTSLITAAGVSAEHIFYKRCLELPGLFRPTKEWDLLVVRDDQLILAL